MESEQPTIAGILINVLNNAPVEVVGHADDEEIKIGDVKTTTSVEEKSETKQSETKELDTESKLTKNLFSELIDKKISGITKNSSNVDTITDQELQSMDIQQIQKLLNTYSEFKHQEDFEDIPLPESTRETIKKHTEILKSRIETLKSNLDEREKQAELISKQKAKTPSTTTKKRGRPKEIDIIKSILRDRLASAVDVDLKKEKETLKKFNDGIKLTKTEYFNLPLDFLQKLGAMNADEFSNYRQRIKSSKKPLPAIELEDDDEDIMKKPSRPKLTDEQRAVLLAPIQQQGTPSRPKTLTPKQLQQIASPPTRIPIISEDTPVIEGQGLKDYMNYMKGKRPTKDMKKLILLIGSKQAGNNSYKLKVEIEKLMNKIKTDLEKKIQLHKSKLAKQELKAVAKAKQKIKIKQQAKQLLEQEKLN